MQRLTYKQEDEVITEEAPSRLCVHCKAPRTRLYKVSDAGAMTKNSIMACLNPDCFLFVHLERLTSWRTK